MSILRNASVTCLFVTYFPQCHMSNLRNYHVTCHYLFLPPCSMSPRLMSHVDFKKSPCRCVESKGRGAMCWMWDTHLLPSVYVCKAHTGSVCNVTFAPSSQNGLHHSHTFIFKYCKFFERFCWPLNYALLKFGRQWLQCKTSLSWYSIYRSTRYLHCSRRLYHHQCLWGKYVKQVSYV